jgi:hypothetical protein
MPSTFSQLLPLIGAIVGASIAFLTNRWSLKRADDLARQRERQRDDRQHLRGFLVARLERQHDALGAYANLIKSDAGATLEGHTSRARELILAAFEREDLATEAVAAAERLPKSGNASRREPLAYLAAMTELAQQTRELVQVPDVADWRPSYERALKAEDKKLEDQMRNAGWGVSTGM